MTTTVRRRSAAGPAASRGAERALQRRRRRENRLTGDRVRVAGRPVRSAMLRVPFVVALIAVLGFGVAGVLYLNTKADESGMRTEQAKASSSQLRLEIEALTRSIAELSATPRIAQQAKSLGLVPAGDAAILVVDDAGHARLVGTPSRAGHAPPEGSGGGR